MSAAVHKAPPSPAQRGNAGMGVRRQIANARMLRRNSTDVERKLWHRVREKQIEGFRFRRQRPIGTFIVDFVCLETKLIVELDGGQHADAVPADATRTAFLESLGYRVIRFWNNEVLDNMAGVLERIRELLLQPSQSNPTPALPFAGEGAERESANVSARSPSPAMRGKAGMGVRSNGAAANKDTKASIK